MRIRIYKWILCWSIMASSLQAETPNIVVIMADDVGLGDIGFQHKERTGGQKPFAETPNIDALAEAGMWFTDAHSPTSLCSPTRYAVMSGNYNYRSYAPWGVWGSFRETPIKPEDATLGRVAQHAGYKTGFVGKWHLGGDFHKKSSKEFYRGNDRGETDLDVDATEWISGGPQDMGFDYDFTLPTGVQGPFYVAYENGKWHPLSENSKLINLNKNTAKDPFFVSDKGPGTGDSEWDATEMNVILAEKAANFIRSNADEPFFLCYWSPAVHIPHTPPDSIDGKPIKGTTITRHLDMVRVLDLEVKEIVDALKETGEYDNTLIIFTSDNGGLWNSKNHENGHLSSGGWRGNKNAPHEGGQRVPFIAVWPGHIPAGSRSDALVNGTDILATIAAITGENLEDHQAMDSWNLLPAFRGSENFESREELMLQSGSRHELMFRQGPWKLIIDSNHHLTQMDPVALFNLETNPQEKESENLINNPEYKERAEAMFKRYMEIREGGERTAPKNS
ncbi:arylsulfatase [Rubellicoccus peritrichatus]|uniref:Arylsulfatase n=1 Tax=Rubellicoccus peritrichatus TaxID=3080537 RepID=A0AAQ3L5E5_9BACT|nr:arylsulfatase [Puniceicoccus sp. CR14]WOO39311.1 arylsulfatase [Puniceicoccus sp. CR14]